MNKVGFPLLDLVPSQGSHFSQWATTKENARKFHCHKKSTPWTFLTLEPVSQHTWRRLEPNLPGEMPGLADPQQIQPVEPSLSHCYITT